MHDAFLVTMVHKFLKRIVPLHWRVFVRAMLKNMRVMRNGRVSGLRLVSAVSVALEEQCGVTGLLDYSRREIRMVVHSHRELRRLEACAKEPETVHWMETHLRRGDVFYDIGANVGAYSFLAWAVSGGGADIFSFEPVAATYASLCRNIMLNRCAERVRALPIALGAETSFVPLYLSSAVAGAASHSFSAPHNGLYAGNENFLDALQQVLAYRLDDCVSAFAFPQPTLMKIDVDGGELDVVRGAMETLHSPELRSLVVEVDYRLNTARALIGEIKRAGFRAVGDFPRKRPELRNVIFEREQYHGTHD